MKIEKNIPAPFLNGAEIFNNFKKMEIGDSFVCDKGCQTSFTSLSRRAGILVKSRSISLTEVRVWRVA